MKTSTKLITLASLFITLSLALLAGPVAVVDAKPPTKTPTPSGPTATATPSQTPTNTPVGGGGAHAHYVDCSAPTNGDGSQASPWNSVTTASAHTYGPGDSLLFKRGVTCNGAFVAQGSGSAAAPITLADYGAGVLPVIDGGTLDTHTVYIHNVQYYDLKNLAIRGSTRWAVEIIAEVPGNLYHFHVINLDISGVNYVAQTRTDSGLLGIWPNSSSTTFNDILIDGVIAHDSTSGQGISIGGGQDWPCGNCGSGFIIRNSIVHDVGSDGIEPIEMNDGVIENNVAYNTGECACTGTTPVGIWTWNTNNVVFQFNESYGAQTWAAGDGGGFDIDGQNQNNTIQYNYAHDNAGFCFAVYDWGSANDTLNSVVRYNLCANNVRSVPSYGEIRVASWQGGFINALQMYNNTFYYDPAPATIDGESAAIKVGANYVGDSFFKNNIIYSTYRRLMRTSGALIFDYNLYYTPPGVGYQFKYGTAQEYDSLSAWQAATGFDLHSTTGLDPKLNGLGYHGVGMPNLTNGHYTLQTASPALGAGTNVCAVACLGGSMGPRDFFGITLDATHNIGAYEGNGQ